MADTTYGILAGPYSAQYDMSGGADAFQHNMRVAEMRWLEDRRNTAIFQKENPIPVAADRALYQLATRMSNKREAARESTRKGRKTCQTCFSRLTAAGGCNCRG